MRKTLSILALLLLASSLTLSTFPTATETATFPTATSGGGWATATFPTATAHAPITIDGDPSDWTGTPPATNNTWKYDTTAKEWIWTDEVGDDKGNGTYTYPTANVSGTQKRAFNPGDFDLKELRIAWNDTGVAFLMKFVNITDDDWVGKNTQWPSSWLSDPIEAETTAIAICIDTDRVDGSGYDLVDDGADGISADIRLPSVAYWEYLIEIVLGDIVLWRYNPATMAPVEALRSLPSSKIIPCAADNTSAHEAVEFMVPIDATGIAGLPDPTGETWRFSVFIGSQDTEHFREVVSVQGSIDNPWQGGGGADHEFDPDAYDAAFFANKTAQEKAFNGFTDKDYAIVSAYREIPEFPLTFGFALIAIVVLAASFKLRKKLYL